MLDLEESARLNFERLKREANTLDKTSPDFNSDLDQTVPFAGTGRTYRDMILEGVDPNDEQASVAWIEKEFAIRLTQP